MDRAQKNQLIYEQAFYWSGSSWQKVPLAGLEKIGPWYVGKAFASIPKSGDRTQFIGYICQNEGGVWRCGCKDTACSAPLWQLQSIEHARRVSEPKEDNGTPKAPRDASTWLMGYYIGYLAKDLPLSEVPFEKMTHVAVGRVNIGADGSVGRTFDMRGDSGIEMAEEAVRRAHREGTKALLWVGGPENTSAWRSATKNTTTRRALAKNLVALQKELGYDGFDINWEGLSGSDYDQLYEFVKTLRREAPKGTLVVLPVMWVRDTPSASKGVAWIEDIAPYLDRIFIMSYSMTGTWSGWQSWHSSPLYGAGTLTPSSIDSSVEAYLDAGVPKEKLGIGVGFYGRCFAPPITAPGQEFPATYPSNGITNLPYRTIREIFKDPEAEYAWDKKARAPYLFRESSSRTDAYCSYVSFDDERSIEEKTDFVRDENLGGMMMWTLAQGYLPEADRGDRHPLLDAASKGILGK
jgi:chitinase